MGNIVYLYVLDTMADWEIGYLTAELNSWTTASRSGRSAAPRWRWPARDSLT